jgi:hypothetical protein
VHYVRIKPAEEGFPTYLRRDPAGMARFDRDRADDVENMDPVGRNHVEEVVSDGGDCLRECGVQEQVDVVVSPVSYDRFR